MARFLGTTLISIILFFSCWSTGSKTNATHIPLTMGQESTEQRVVCGEFQYFEVTTTDACKDLRIQLNSVQGDSDMFVTKAPNQYPTSKGLMWTSYDIGDDNLTISSWDPAYVIGTYYIGVNIDCSTQANTTGIFSTFTLLADSVDSSHPSPVVPLNGQVQGVLMRQGYAYYRFCLPTSCANVTIRLTNCQDYATCPNSYSFPELLVSGTVQRPVITDYTWKLIEEDVNEITVTYDDRDLYPGHYFVGVYGYCVPDEICDPIETCGPCANVNNESTFNLSVTVQDVLTDAGCTPKQTRWSCSGVGNSTTNVSDSVSRAVMSPIGVIFVLMFFAFVL